MYVHGYVSSAIVRLKFFFNYRLYNYGDKFYCFRILQGSSDTVDNSNDGGPEFAEVFVIVWIGSMVVTLNSKLLGGNM